MRSQIPTLLRASLIVRCFSPGAAGRISLFLQGGKDLRENLRERTKLAPPSLLFRAPFRSQLGLFGGLAFFPQLTFLLSDHVLSPCYMPGAVLSAFSHLLFWTTLRP